MLGIPADEILHISAKTGEGVPELLDALVARIPAPKGDADAPLQALIFDSIYDAYRGVVSSVRVFNGTLGSGARLRYVQAKANHDAEEIGVRLPVPTPAAALGPGEVGYLIAGIKDVGQARVGETVTTAAHPAEELPGYRDPKPMVFCGLYPVDGDEYAELREALEKLRLNDSSFTYEPETSGALGFGFRCGFLGLLHMEIVRERLEREYDLSLVATAPNVEYQLELVDGTVEIVDNPSAMPTPNEIASIEEPYVNVTVLTPTEYIGSIMELCQQRRGDMTRMEYLSEERVELVYVLPLAEIVMDFFDQLKSRTKGYASLDYEPIGYRASNLSKVDVLLNNVAVDAFSTIVHRDQAYDYGKRMTEKLRELIPRQLFDVPIQAAVGGRIIARETVKAKRKDVIAKCYGGDISRKRKLLDRQKEGKKRMKQIGTRRGPPGGVRGRTPTGRLSVQRRARTGVYVHIPFCAARCDYCDFATWTDRAHLVDAYVDACVLDLQRRALLPVDTVFFGGGTPSLLAASQLTAILDAIRAPADAEVTVECNPDSVDVEKLRAYADVGVNRLSFGVQSMRPHVLVALGRTHDPDNVARAVDAARAAGHRPVQPRPHLRHPGRVGRRLVGDARRRARRSVPAT